MTNLQTSRTRVISWEDPTAAVQTGKTISGIAYLRALQSGELPPPPVAVLLDMWITEVSEGRVVFAVEPAEYLYHPRTQGQLPATDHGENWNSLLRRQDHSRWRTHRHRRGPLDRRFWQTLR